MSIAHTFLSLDAVQEVLGQPVTARNGGTYLFFGVLPRPGVGKFGEFSFLDLVVSKALYELFEEFISEHGYSMEGEPIIAGGANFPPGFVGRKVTKLPVKILFQLVKIIPEGFRPNLLGVYDITYNHSEGSPFVGNVVTNIYTDNGVVKMKKFSVCLADGPGDPNEYTILNQFSPRTGSLVGDLSAARSFLGGSGREIYKNGNFSLVEGPESEDCLCLKVGSAQLSRTDCFLKTLMFLRELVQTKKEMWADSFDPVEAGRGAKVILEEFLEFSRVMGIPFDPIFTYIQ